MKADNPKAYSYVRFSKASQKHGDSERRQTEDVNPEAIAKKLGLTLDNELKLIDRGFSGFTGEHRAKGALGEFEKLIELGEIASGSVLIIEELDRLTREAILEAVHLMTGILLKGVGIYTGMDEQYYTKDSFDFGLLVLSANKLQTGHEESLKKSKRLGARWENKRNMASDGGLKLTSISPYWLKETRNKKGKVEDFEVIEERALAVKKIFELKAQGFGNKRIAQYLNDDYSIWQPPKSKRNKTGGWAESTIQRYISDVRVLGSFQTHKRVKGKRMPIGEPIKDYYPRIISNELYYAVQNQIQCWHEKQGHSGGRTGKATNIFSHITKCGICGGSMHYVDKGSKGGQYLRCDTSRRGLKDESGTRICSAKAVTYESFFTAFFKYVDELDIHSLLPDPHETQTALDQNLEKIEANQQLIKEATLQEANLIDTIAMTDSKEVRKVLDKKLASIIQKREEIEWENKTLSWEQVALRREAKELRETVSDALSAREYLTSPKSESGKIEARIKLRGLVRKLITKLEIYPLTEKYRRMEELEEETGIYLHMESRYIQKFRVHFNTNEPHKAIIALKRYLVTK